MTVALTIIMVLLIINILLIIALFYRLQDMENDQLLRESQRYSIFPGAPSSGWGKGGPA